MSSNAKGGAPASPDRFGPIDWISLAVFTAPIWGYALRSLAGGF